MTSFINARRLLLVLGDMLLILVATYLSPVIRLGVPIDILARQTGASVFTLFLYLVALYIFDLYNTDRFTRAKSIASRMVVVVAVAGVLSGFLFYSLPGWTFGRGIFLVQMVLVWGFLIGWRWVYTLVFQTHTGKKDTLIIGAGRSGFVMNKLLADVTSPYRVVGFLDDDPSKQGELVGSPKVVGTTDQLMEVASKRRLNNAILAITYNRPAELISCILKARLKGMTILEMPSLSFLVIGRRNIYYAANHL